MLSELDYELTLFIAKAKLHLPMLFLILGMLWGINLVNWYLLGSRLNIFGIWPRKPFGLIGIIFSPVLHKNFNHLFFNSIPLFALSLFVMTYGITLYAMITIIIIILEGLLTWLFGRRGIHIGASSLITGYFGFILVSAYSRPSITTLFLAALTLYYFGSIILSLFPTEEKVSWEGHLLGFIAGIMTKFIIALF